MICIVCVKVVIKFGWSTVCPSVLNGLWLMFKGVFGKRVNVPILDCKRVMCLRNEFNMY